MDRRNLLKNSMALGGLAGLGACAAETPPPAPAPTRAASRVPLMDRPPRLKPIRAHADRLYDMKCCIRPFRTRGPNLDVEQVGDATVVHNYGHGGSGWSLSWGSADMQVQKAMSFGPKKVAVIGSGIIGLTTAITAQRAGAQVTIYTRELLPRTRSVRANGSWTPSSRIALELEAPPGFDQIWEQMARISWKTLRFYNGLAGKPIDWCDHYRLSETAPGQPPEPINPNLPPLPTPSWTGAPIKSSDFSELDHLIDDLTPRAEVLTPETNPFPTKYATRTSQLFFNFSEYGHLLVSDFFDNGGKIVMRDFHSPSELGHLPEKVVINCPGYAAHDWWRDKYMVPVRGQTGWLISQPEVHYALTYRSVQTLSKSDGIMVMALEHGDMKGYYNSNETVDRAESERAIKVLEELFSRFTGVPA